MSPHVDVGEDIPFLPHNRPTSVFDGIGGFVRALTSCTPDHPEGLALLAAARAMQQTPWVAGQFADPAVAAANVKAWPLWTARWRQAGAVVFKWWRVEHWYEDSFPGPDDAQGIPNPESQHEFDRLPKLLPFHPAAIATLGKPAGIDVGLLRSRRVWALAECFREGPQSDHTITNSHDWWARAGFDMDRWTPMLQAYGTPFSPLIEQAKEAEHLGCLGVAIYPLDGADPVGVRAAGEVMA